MISMYAAVMIIPITAIGARALRQTTMQIDTNIGVNINAGVSREATRLRTEIIT